MTIEFLYILGCLIGLAAVVPQLHKVWQAKSSRELSLKTYITWTVTASITLTYVISIQATLMIVTSAIWVLYYVIMVSMITYYRQPRQQPDRQPVYIEQKSDI